MIFKDNRLLMIISLSLAAYWSLGWYVPGLILSTSLSVFSVLTGLAITVRYFEGFYGVLFRGHRSAERDGSYLAALGIPAIAASIVWGGCWTLAWNLAGQPADWLGTPSSNFSRLLLVGGCVALYLTPDIQRDKLSLPSVVWLALLMATAILTAFLLGAFLGDDRLASAAQIRPVYYPTCPVDRPVWVASNSTLFHDEGSPWRAEIIPRRCFASPEEAISAGFSRGAS